MCPPSDKSSVSPKGDLGVIILHSLEPAGDKIVKDVVFLYTEDVEMDTVGTRGVGGNAVDLGWTMRH